MHGVEHTSSIMYERRTILRMNGNNRWHNTMKKCALLLKKLIEFKKKTNL